MVYTIFLPIMFGNSNRMSPFQIFIICVTTLVLVQSVTLFWNIIDYAVDDKVYEEGNYKQLYLGSLITRVLWTIPILFALKSLKNYYQVLTNKSCCDNSIETVILSYTMINVIPNLMFDCFNIAFYIAKDDTEIYKIQGPYTFIAMIVPILLGIMLVFLTICLDKYRYERLPVSEV